MSSVSVAMKVPTLRPTARGMAKLAFTVDEPLPAMGLVVLQSDDAQEAASVFQMDERFLRYAWKRHGLRCQEPRPGRTRFSNKPEKLADWNIEEA